MEGKRSYVQKCKNKIKKGNNKRIPNNEEMPQIKIT